MLGVTSDVELSDPLSVCSSWDLGYIPHRGGGEPLLLGSLRLYVQPR